MPIRGTSGPQSRRVAAVLSPLVLVAIMLPLEATSRKGERKSPIV